MQPECTLKRKTTKRVADIFKWNPQSPKIILSFVIREKFQVKRHPSDIRHKWIFGGRSKDILVLSQCLEQSNGTGTAASNYKDWIVNKLRTKVSTDKIEHRYGSIPGIIQFQQKQIPFSPIDLTDERGYLPDRSRGSPKTLYRSHDNRLRISLDRATFQKSAARVNVTRRKKASNMMSDQISGVKLRMPRVCSCSTRTRKRRSK